MEAAGTVGARRATEDGQSGIPQKKEGESDAGGTANRIAKPCQAVLDESTRSYLFVLGPIRLVGPRQRPGVDWTSTGFIRI
jgi:hypothetical protein